MAVLYHAAGTATFPLLLTSNRKAGIFLLAINRTDDR